MILFLIFIIAIYDDDYWIASFLLIHFVTR